MISVTSHILYIWQTDYREFGQLVWVDWINSLQNCKDSVNIQWLNLLSNYVDQSWTFYITCTEVPPRYLTSPSANALRMMASYILIKP